MVVNSAIVPAQDVWFSAAHNSFGAISPRQLVNGVLIFVPTLLHSQSRT